MGVYAVVDVLVPSNGPPLRTVPIRHLCGCVLGHHTDEGAHTDEVVYGLVVDPEPVNMCARGPALLDTSPELVAQLMRLSNEYGIAGVRHTLDLIESAV